MKKALVLFIAMAVACTLISCGGSGSSSADSSLGTVTLGVSGLDSQRVVSVTGGTSTFYYYYKATPNWTGTDVTTPQGKTSDFTQITYSAGVSLGYFAQGNWTFEVEVRDGTSESANVLYSGSTTQYINAGSNTISIAVTKDTTGKGTIAFSITAPTVEASDKITIPTSPSVTVSPTLSYADNITTATVAATEFDSGNYTITILHTKADGTAVGGATMGVNVANGTATTVSGTIESGVWQAEALTLTGITTFSITVSGSASVAKSTDATFTATATITGSTVSSYQWYVNGVAQSGATSASYTFNQASGGYYQVSCVAEAADGTLAGVDSFITVTE